MSARRSSRFATALQVPAASDNATTTQTPPRLWENARSFPASGRTGSSLHRESGPDPRLDMKSFARGVWRTGGRREKSSAAKVRRSLKKRNQRWGILRNADDLQPVAFESKLSGIGMIGKNLGQRIKRSTAFRAFAAQGSARRARSLIYRRQARAGVPPRAA